MIKLVYCIRRRAGVSPDAFRKHWRESHAPRVAEGAAAGRLLLEDERSFIDLETSSLFLTAEHEIF